MKEKSRIFRERFYGRPDVFGTLWEATKEDGTPIKGYNPSCDNLWSEGCHIRLKDGINCTNCEIQKFTPVSNDTVVKHINGEQPQMHYMLQQDGTIKFGAFDFDYKPGKESMGYTFEDVKRVIKVLNEWGMHYVLARSTGNGYHIYFFMEDFYPARKFRSVIWEIMDRCGFMLENQNGIRPLPEVFPKQNFISSSGLGNGIKPPMIEANFPKERNCLVDDNDVMIPAAKQWEYLDKSPRIKTKFLDDLIEKFNIPLEPDHSVSISGRAKGSGPGGRPSPGAVNGSIEKILEGCSALRSLRDKMSKTQYVPTHFEGMGLWHLAMATLDGKDWFINNVPGWGKDSSGFRQLEHSEKKGYSPWTCRKLQENGVCPVGTKCFDKKPPIEYIEGKPVQRTDIPESQWPEPSPIRYALGKGEDFLRRLMTEIDEIATLEDVEQRSNALSAVVQRAAVFDDNQQALLKAHIDSLKLAKKSELNKMFIKMNQNRSEKSKEVQTSGSDYFSMNGVMFRYMNPGYAVIRPGKKNQDDLLIQLSDCYIDITEERTVIDEDKVKKKVLFGKFSSPALNLDFDIDSDSWADSGEFCKFFIRLCGIAFRIKRGDIDLVRQIIHYTSENGRQGIAPCKRTIYYSAPGWYDETYITPSVIIDKNGLKPNTEKPIDNKDKEHAGNIDFKLLNTQEVSQTLFHIKTDFLNTFYHDQAMLGLGFTMMSSIVGYLKLPYKPTFWLEGTTGGGKTALCLALQAFYGDFKGGVNWKTTENSMLDYAYQFKDVMMLADDFKNRSIRENDACASIIQNSYEHTIRGSMKKDGGQRGDKFSRAMFLMSGEEVPTNHASVLARMVIINCPAADTMKTRDTFNKVQDMKGDYKAVTPHFIHWVLGQDKHDIIELMESFRDRLQAPVTKEQNSARISYNIALCYTGWVLFCKFMAEFGQLTPKEVDSFSNEAWEYCEELRDIMIDKCKDEQSANILISRITELLGSGMANIQNLAGYNNNDRATVIGFIDPKDEETHIAYLYPNVTIELVKKNMSNPLVISSSSAGVQLKANDVIVKNDGKGKNQIVKRYDNKTARVWAVDLRKFGINTPLKAVNQSEPMRFESDAPVQPIIQEANPIAADDGLF